MSCVIHMILALIRHSLYFLFTYFLFLYVIVHNRVATHSVFDVRYNNIQHIHMCVYIYISNRNSVSIPRICYLVYVLCFISYMYYSKVQVISCSMLYDLYFTFYTIAQFTLLVIYVLSSL